MLNQDKSVLSIKYRVSRLLILIGILAIALFLWKDTAVAPSPSGFSGNLPIFQERLKETTVLAVGDILLSRHVGTQIDKANNPNLPFQNLQDLLAGADITFGNLECPLSPSEIPVREGMVFRCLTKYVPGLVDAGFDVLSTANNHALDQGLNNLEFTIDYLLSRNIKPVGTRKISSPAHPNVVSNSIELDTTQAVINKNDLTIAFLAYSYSAFNDGKKSSHSQIMTMNNLETLKSSILNLKSNNHLVIVSMHAGTEYTRHPNQEQIDFAHAAIQAGADVVIGHHPHWIQNIEIYQGRPVFYSLGNFVFDQAWSQETKEGLAIRLKIKDSRLQSAELIPVIIENNCCPRVADETEKTRILKKINLDSPIINF